MHGEGQDASRPRQLREDEHGEGQALALRCWVDNSVQGEGQDAPRPRTLRKADIPRDEEYREVIDEFMHLFSAVGDKLQDSG